MREQEQIEARVRHGEGSLSTHDAGLTLKTTVMVFMVGWAVVCLEKTVLNWDFDIDG